MNMDVTYLNRAVNEGFSGGERKRNEILQLAVLGAEMAVLDEIDSGLDIDALRDVAKAVNSLRSERLAAGATAGTSGAGAAAAKGGLGLSAAGVGGAATAAGSATWAAKGVEGRGLLMITHYRRLLDLVVPDIVHVMGDGKILETGGMELVDRLEAAGYGEMSKSA